ncbi:MAG: type ISP restriction/modification enzyme, partial [Rhodanobacteraceae bacterium]
MKLIPFAQWRIEQTGRGVLAFITNHGYLDNPTFMDMRESLLKSFDTIWLYDLHGNGKKKEKAPGGGKDENVFDIQQGVAIGIFVKHAPLSSAAGKAADETTGQQPTRGHSGAARSAEPGIHRPSEQELDSGSPLRGVRNDEQEKGVALARVFHADLYGTRVVKYATLDAESVATTAWTELAPAAPTYLLVPQDADLLAEYECGWSLREVFAPNGDPAPGIVTTNDEFAISWTREEAAQKVERLLAKQTEAEACGLFKLCSQDQWQYARAKRELADGAWRERIVPVLYRPFDVRWTVYDRNVAVHRRERAFDNFVGHANVALAMMRQASVDGDYSHLFAIDHVADNRAMYSNRGIMAVSPLWLYPREAKDLLDAAPQQKKPNLAPEFVAALTEAVGTTPTPEDTLAYIYAILYAPSYRARSADFLKRDFPRVPVTTDRDLFATLVGTGRELVALHTMQTTLPRITGFPVPGSNEVVKVWFTAFSPLPPGEAAARPSAQRSPAGAGEGTHARPVTLRDAGPSSGAARK